MVLAALLNPAGSDRCSDETRDGGGRDANGAGCAARARFACATEFLLQEALAEAHELGNVDLYANTTHSLADLSLDRGAWDDATERYLESLAVKVARNDR